jgi:hypothetical protein
VSGLIGATAGDGVGLIRTGSFVPAILEETIMLHPNDIQHRFYFVERAVRLAAQAASAEPGLPRELRNCLELMDKHVDDAREILQAAEEARVRKLVRDLDLLGERAKRICNYIPTLSGQMKGAVSHMHSQIQELKRDMSV